MVNFIAALFFTGVYLMVLRVEKLKFGSILTPYFFLVTPVIVIFMLNILLVPFTDFIMVSVPVILMWVVFSITFLLGATPFWLLTGKNSNRIEKNVNIKSISFFSIFLSAIMLIIAVNIILSGPNIHYISTEQFASDFGRGLVIPLFRVTTMVCLIFLIGHADKVNKLALFSIAFTLIPLFIYQVKGVILIPIIGGIIYRIYLEKLRVTSKLIGNLVILGFLIFVLSYSVSLIYIFGFQYVLNFEFVIEMFEHVFGYLFSGILGFTAYFDSSLIFTNEPQRIISPIWNTLRHVTGWDRVEVVTALRFDISENSPFSSNVFTLFGTMYGYVGLTLTLFGSAILGALSYSLMFFTYRLKNPWLNALYYFNLAVLSLGWFDYYYNYTFVWMFYAIVLMFLIYSIIKKPKFVLHKKSIRNTY